MKKLVALLLAAMMVLGAVSVFAEGTEEVKSPTTTPTTPVVPPTDEGKTFFILVELATVGQEYRDKLIAAEADQLSVFAPETQDAIKSAVGETIVVNDMTDVEVVNWTEADGPQVLKLECQTEYKVGDPVLVVLAIVKDGVVEYAMPTVVEEDSVLAISWSSEMMAKGMEADEIVLMVVSLAD